jgi:hypothetical protein
MADFFEHRNEFLGHRMRGIFLLAELLVESQETCFMELVKISKAYFLYDIWTDVFAVHTWKLGFINLQFYIVQGEQQTKHVRQWC